MQSRLLLTFFLRQKLRGTKFSPSHASASLWMDTWWIIDSRLSVESLVWSKWILTCVWWEGKHDELVCLTKSSDSVNRHTPTSSYQSFWLGNEKPRGRRFCVSSAPFQLLSIVRRSSRTLHMIFSANGDDQRKWTIAMVGGTHFRVSRPSSSFFTIVPLSRGCVPV